jgi:hypothetical protein
MTSHFRHNMSDRFTKLLDRFFQQYHRVSAISRLLAPLAINFKISSYLGVSSSQPGGVDLEATEICPITLGTKVPIELRTSASCGVSPATLML